ncbi:MAG: extracellular solute-binding protein, partial [Chloroflexi bacterium]|nr:extracellular solute-binding protein [Chloroflexota bacterium]
MAALTVAACSSGPGGTPNPSLPTSIGAGEGELNLVIWAGYAERGATFPEFDWVTPFEKKTGCKVNATNQTDSANGVSLMQSGNYDGGALSGNATVRLMTGGTVAPVNVDLLPNYKNVFEGLKNKVHNSIDGVPYGVPHGRGPNVLMYNTEGQVSAPPGHWRVGVERECHRIPVTDTSARAA